MLHFCNALFDIMNLKLNKTHFLKEEKTMKNSITNKIVALYTKVKNAPAVARIAMLPTLAMTLILTQGRSASAAGGADLSGVTNPIVELLNSFVPYLLALVGAGGAIFCIFLGVKYATAEEPQEREKRKQALKTAIIGYVLIFILIVALRASIGPLTTWMTNASKGQ